MGFLREPSHLLLVLLVVVVLFGSRKLPDAARGLGRSMRIFKAEMQQMKDDDQPRRPASDDAPRSGTGEPLEGRVIRPDSTRADERSGETPRNL
jgi:sec-independent protein translocase protein TatA